MAETSVSSTAATTPPPLPPWSEEIECILDNSLREMPIIVAKDSNPVQQEESANTSACTLCCLVKNRKLDPIEIIDRFRHDLVVLKGSKRVWNLSKKAKYDPGVGDYLFTPAGWEGKWDIFFDEEMEVAKSEIEKEAGDGFELLGGRFHARLGRNARENTHNGELVTDFQEKNLFLWPASLL
ncbi:hypothetical protein NC652_030839 [Populus alba x Populus x berolinensis]|nr:hypothetical protein NC652_030839 [Populus alba x Populus x berolinensis]